MMLLFHDERGFNSSDINRIVITGIVLIVFIGVVRLQSFPPAALKERLRGTVNFLHDVLPFISCIVIYTNMHYMVHFINPNDIDEWPVKTDLYLLGFRPAVEMQAYIPQPLTDDMFFAYAMFSSNRRAALY